jgi:energy-coupling factor transport system substrate-specific component
VNQRNGKYSSERLVVKMKKIRAREITLLAVMTALCVASNEICTHTLPLHAGTALVILCGIGLGPRAGFVVGAFARFFCNFFDGQGPWTPWEMAAWGLLGIVAGICFNKVVLKRRLPGERQTLAKRLSLRKEQGFRLVMLPVICILISWIVAYVTYLWSGGGETFFGWRLYGFGVAGMIAGILLQKKRLSADAVTMTIFTFFVVFLLYGGIMNFASLVLLVWTDSSQQFSMEALKGLYITGVPYDLEHAAGAALCVFVLGEGILQKLQRIQIKFGIHF